MCIFDPFNTSSMKAILISALMLLTYTMTAQQPALTRESLQKVIVSQGLDGVEVHYSVPGITRSPVSTEGKNFDFLHINGMGLMREPGKPALPAVTEMIAIPMHAGATLSSWSESYSDFYEYRIHPAFEPATDTYGASDPPFVIDSALYATDAFFPEKLAEVVDTILIRGLRVAVVQIRPVQYNPVQGLIRVHKDITMQFGFTGEGRTFNPLASENSAYYNQYLSSLLLNGDMIPPGIMKTAGTSTADYLIITIDPFMQAADSIARWRQQTGFHTEVISRPSWTVQQVIDSVHGRYHNSIPRPDYLLILGDHNHVPAQMFPSGSSSFPTDLYYVCMNGSADYYPDMAKGRISVANASQALSVVLKIINYERYPLQDTLFYQNALHCAQFQDDDTSGYATRRFTHTSEEIRDYVMGKGFDIQRIYYTEPYINPTNYNNGYYSNGEPLPPDLLRVNGFTWSGNQTQIAQAINEGRFYVLHRDHGYVGGSGWAHPYFTTTSLNQLSNGPKLPMVFSINCHTGEFSLNECFAEKFLRLSSGGAAGVVAASFESYSGYNDAMTVGLFDAIWNDQGLLPLFGSGGIANPVTSSHPPILAMGDVVNHGLLRMVQTWNGSTSGNTYQHRLFHYFGDPATRMFTASPQQIMAQVPDTIVKGTSHLTITNCNVSDALATLVFKDVLVARDILLSGAGTLHCSPMNDTAFRALLTISKHNCTPFIKEVVIVSQAAAVNDHPCGAVSLTVNKYCDPVISGFAGADTSSVPYPGCAEFHGKDVWFRFVAPASGKAEAEVGDGLQQVGLAAYTSTCNTPLFVACDTFTNAAGRVVLPMSGLTPGDTIHLRVWKNGSNAPESFSICIREPDTFLYATLPYYTGFETGIDAFWQMISSNTVGRIRIDTVCDARYGNASLLLDQNVSGTYAQNEARLRMNLRDTEKVKLKFWWREYGDENNEEDGLFFSDDGGDNFVKVLELKGSFEAWTQYVLDVDKLAGLHGLTLTESFVISFRQYDNWYMICSNQTGGDGFAFDDIYVYADTIPVVYAPIPYYTGFGDGFDASWKLSSTDLLGRIVATGAYGPYAGGYQLLMDVSTGSNYNLNKADLHLNLNNLNNLVMSYRWKSIGNENHGENGIWFSDNGGISFKKVMNLTDTNTYWAEKNININAVTAAYNLVPGQQFVVRFAQYDNHPVTSDGFGFDEIKVQQLSQPLIDLWPIALSLNVDTGQTGTKSFYLFNPGTNILYVDSIRFPEAFSAGVTLPAAILPGDSLMVNVDFSPDSVKQYDGWVRVYHQASQGLDTLRLHGLGMYRELIPDIAGLVFDTLEIQNTDTIEFQLTNAGNGTVAMSAVTAPAGFSVLTPQSQNFSVGQSRAVRVMFEPLSPGTYSGLLTITTDANQISLPVSGFAYDPLSVVEKDTEPPFVIFPNPCNDQIMIASSINRSVQVRLLDMTGRLLFHENLNSPGSIDINLFAEGMYLLEIRSDAGKILHREKIIKNR